MRNNVNRNRATWRFDSFVFVHGSYGSFECISCRWSIQKDTSRTSHDLTKDKIHIRTRILPHTYNCSKFRCYRYTKLLSSQSISFPSFTINVQNKQMVFLPYLQHRKICSSKLLVWPKLLYFLFFWERRVQKHILCV